MNHDEHHDLHNLSTPAYMITSFRSERVSSRWKESNFHLLATIILPLPLGEKRTTDCICHTEGGVPLSFCS